MNVAVTGSLLFNAPWVHRAYGPREPGRQILLAIYKLLTPLTVGTLKNPVVLSSVAIAALHVTLSTVLHT